MSWVDKIVPAIRKDKFKEQGSSTSVPEGLWKMCAKCDSTLYRPELDKNLNPHEATFLKLDISKAKSQLNWNPSWSLDESLKCIIDWNEKFMKNENMYQYSVSVIRKFNSL